MWCLSHPHSSSREGFALDISLLIPARLADRVVDAIELVVLPASPKIAFDLLTLVIESDRQIAEQSGDADLQPTFERPCDLLLMAAAALPAAELSPALAQLTAADDYRLRQRLKTSQ